MVPVVGRKDDEGLVQQFLLLQRVNHRLNEVVDGQQCSPPW